MNLPQLTRAEAIAFDADGMWKTLSDVEQFAFQLSQDCLCMPFEEYQRCAEVALARPVFTREFARPDTLKAELASGDKASFEDVMMKLVEMMEESR